MAHLLNFPPILLNRKIPYVTLLLNSITVQVKYLFNPTAGGAQEEIMIAPKLLYPLV